ncbi:unnamed protein product [Calicophoron daubneyi]|uniref:Uncharacterized protein n=1 Tax=Calicophoron daubneyi TaxID=300641 RepID=A0AAV2SZU4_CALDB
MKSWKFPSQEALRVELYGLLENVKYIPNNKEKNEMIHVFLLELIVDRLLLVMRITENTFQDLRGLRLPDNKKEANEGTANSIGDSARRFAHSALEAKKSQDIHDDGFQVTPSEDNSAPSAFDGVLSVPNIAEQTLQWINATEKQYRNLQLPFRSHLQMGENVGMNPSKCQELSCRNKEDQSTQTSEPQNSSVQMHLIFDPDLESDFRRLCIKVAQFMDQLGLPSEAGRLLIEDRLTDFSFGQERQTFATKASVSILARDFDRISRTIRADKESLSEAKLKALELSRVVDENKKTAHCLTNEIDKIKKDAQHELESLSSSHRQTELESLRLRETLSAAEIKVLQKIAEIERLNHNVQTYEQERSLIKRALNCSNDELVHLDSCSSVIVENAVNFRGECRKLKAQTSGLEKQLKVQEVEMQNLEIQLSNMNKKHNDLLERVDEILTQKAMLTDQLAEKSTELDDAQNELNNVKTANAELEAKRLADENLITCLQNSNEELKVIAEEKAEKVRKLVELTETLEKKAQLLVQYPDLNGPIEIETDLTPQSVEAELRGQIKANEYRILLLTEQTDRLKNAQEKIKDKPSTVEDSTTSVYQTEHQEHTTRLNPVDPVHSPLSCVTQPSSSIDTRGSEILQTPDEIRQRTYVRKDRKRTDYVPAPPVSPTVELWSGPSGCKMMSRRTKTKREVTGPADKSDRT